MIEMEGNIFNTTAPAIGHGVNVDGRMGAGIAVQFKTLFPEMHRHYVGLCGAGYLQPGEVFYYPHPQFGIYNIASQDRPGKNARMEWLEDGLRATISHAEGLNYGRVALPHIGCGIGGLSLSDVRPLLLDVEAGTSVQFELWTYVP